MAVATTHPAYPVNTWISRVVLEGRPRHLQRDMHFSLLAAGYPRRRERQSQFDHANNRTQAALPR
jgi:hypothetical protein